MYIGVYGLRASPRGAAVTHRRLGSRGRGGETGAAVGRDCPCPAAHEEGMP